MGTVETTGAFVRVSARTRAWEKAEKKEMCIRDRHCGRRWLNMAENQFLSTRVLELKPSGAKTGSFVGLSVMTNEFVVGVLGHRRTQCPFCI